MSEITTIQPDRMSAIIKQIAGQIEEVMRERASDMLASWHENIEEANENEDKFPPLKLSLSATVDLAANKVETALIFSTRYKTTVSAMLPDPDQPDLPGV